MTQVLVKLDAFQSHLYVLGVQSIRQYTGPAPTVAA